MKKWKSALIIVLLIASIGFNVMYLARYHSITRSLFLEYKSQISIAHEALNASIISEDEITKQQYFIATHRALARARILTEAIGIHDQRYAYQRNGEIYFAIPYEMDCLLEIATYSENSEEDLKAVAAIFSVYASNVREAKIENTNIAKATLRNIHQEINSGNMLTPTMSTPTSFFKF